MFVYNFHLPQEGKNPMRNEPGMLRRWFLGGALALAASAALPAVAARTGAKRVFGIVPYLPARRLVGLYAPLKPVFEGVLGQEVELSSAPSYAEHLARVRAGHYDIVADALIHARLAQRESGHVPLARTLAPLEPVLAVRADAPVQTLEQLKWGVIAIALTDRSASLGVIGLRFLRDQNRVAGRDFRLVLSGTHANSLQLLLAGEVEAVIVSRTALAQVDASLAAQARVLMPLGRGLSAVVYHVAPRLGSLAPALAKALLDFAAQPAGQSFVAALGHRGLTPATDADMKALDPLVVELHRQMREES